jgi:hypothetical protein
MSFSFCLIKSEVLLLAGFGLLFQGLNLDHKGKIIQDSQRLLCAVIEILERNAAPGAADFKKVACAMISVNGVSKNSRATEDTATRRKSDGTMPAPKNVSKSARKLQAIASRFSSGNGTPILKRQTSSGRRSTAPTLPVDSISYYARSNSQNSVSSVVSDPMPRSGYSSRTTTSQSPRQIAPVKPPNLDYLSFNNDPTPSPHGISPNLNENKNENELGGLPSCNNGQQGQPPLESLFPATDMFSTYLQTPPAGTIDWSADIWNMPSDLGNQHTTSRSFSDEELTSGEELSNRKTGKDFNGIDTSNVDGLVSLEGLDQNYGL